MKALSRGATKCLDRLRWYASHYTRVFPEQKKLAAGLDVSDRQLRRYLAELQHCCTDQCLGHCDGAAGHVGLIDVRQGGDGRAASYTLTDASPRQNVRADVRADVRAEIGHAIAQPSPDAAVADENVRAERPYYSCSSSSACISHSPGVQHHSPLVNDAVPETTSAESQNPNQEAAIAEIWAVAQPRVVVKCSCNEATKAAIAETARQGRIGGSRQARDSARVLRQAEGFLQSR